ncbi:hypothetical protein CF65_02394 [Aggregatibacter actinomycetemcomitans HK1651]|nr:hypothetical protein CF65_02394 [Aggregatibacter actinomycetemcomitans HK1651]
MVEGARLESVYAGNCIGGSNPPLTAILNEFYFALHQSISVILTAVSIIKNTEKNDRTFLCRHICFRS